MTPVEDGMSPSNLRGHLALAHWKTYYGNIKFRTFAREEHFANLIQANCSGVPRVLELACGPGHLLRSLLAKNIKVVGVDINREMLSVKTDKSHQSLIGLVEGDARYLPFRVHSFDVVVCVGLLEHFDRNELEHCLTHEVRRVLKPNGILLAHVPVRTFATSVVRVWRKLIARDLSPYSIDDDNDPTHRIWWRPTQYAELLGSCGFNILLTDYYPYRSSREPRFITRITEMASEVCASIEETTSLVTHRNMIKRFRSNFAFGAYYLGKSQ
ncbi:class I SAM-dependent methyltransferase [Desulfobotulus mexicanus]|nr:class I SAM-dependent methyltransferase [Desulfobotulus mexicanus]